MSKFESKSPETSDEKYGDLIQLYEDLESKERAKEKVDPGPHIERCERLLAPLLKGEIIRCLRAIETKEEALNSKDRKSAKEALNPILQEIKILDIRTNIPKERLDALRAKFKIISNAVGMINNGKVDHDR